MEVNHIVVIAPKMDEILGIDVFPHPILVLVMIENEHELLCKFLKINPSYFLVLIWKMPLSLL